MNVAITIWNGRVSPVLDTAQRLLLLEVHGDAVLSRQEEPIPGTEPLNLADQLTRLNVETLICGALSWPLADLLQTRGMRVLPFVCGTVEAVLEAFLRGELPSPRLAMPGCCGRRNRRGRCGRFRQAVQRSRPDILMSLQ